MHRLLWTAVGVSVGYFVSRFANQLFGLQPLAADLAAWWRANLPSFTYTGGVAP